MLQKRSRSLNKMKNTLTVAILVVCLKTGSGLLSQKPQDSVTVAGKSTYFNCSTSEPSKPILWYHYATNEVHREAIYQYANFTDYWYPCYRKGRYVVERNSETGAFNLVIPMVLLSDAGRYLCEVEGDEGVATLTVQVEPNPTCAASEICKPYIKPYSNAIICIILIVLPIAIGGTIFVMWYLCVYRPKKQKQKEIQVGVSEEEAQQLSPNVSPEVNKEAVAKEKIANFIASSQGNIDYAENPTLVRTLITNAGSQRREPINGMTILGNKLFVSHENNSSIEVYDSETFELCRNWTMIGMSHPMDISSCKITNCLYIIFREDSKSGSHIMKLYVDPNGKRMKKWSTGGEHGRLSTYESNVIVCLFEKQMIKEFNRDGKLILTVSLSPSLGFSHPWHAIKVTSSNFAICYGDTKDELHRVCIVDAQGNIVKKSEIKDGILNVPICLVEDSERSIMVADRDNQKIRLLDCHLKPQQILLKQAWELDGYPVRICLDERKRQLYVATNTLVSKEWKDGGILIFNIR